MTSEGSEDGGKERVQIRSRQELVIEGDAI